MLEAYLQLRRSHDRVDLFLPSSADNEFATLTGLVSAIHSYRFPASRGKLGPFRQLGEISAFGRRVARDIDAGDFDAVLVAPSFFTQGAEVLPFLKTPSLYFAPEYHRGLYDRPVLRLKRSVKVRLADSLYGPAKRRWTKRFDARALQSATAVMTNSEFTRRNLRRIYGVDSEVVYAGVDSKIFRPLEHVRRERLVVSVGAIEPVKGHQFVIEALARIPVRQRPKYLVVGDRGSFAPELSRMARLAGVSLTVKRGISTAELVRIYNRASAHAAAQYNEPFGLTALEVLPNSRATTLEAFTKATTAPGAIVHTDGLHSYSGLAGLGYDHRPRKVASVSDKEKLLPRVHRAISNLGAWMHGTHRGVSPDHLPVYLDEYVFRHNRRRVPMASFQTLLGLGLSHEPVTYREIIDRAA